MPTAYAEVNARAAHNPDGSVLGWVIAIRDVSDRRPYQAELERLATHDPLTGLANHRLFHQRLGEEVAMARRYERPLCVAILDLDHFKQINDLHGHLVGDQALALVAERLAGAVREGELLARVGGEEFGWILPEADEDGAQAAAERARAAVGGAELEPVGRVTVSAGVACLGDGTDASTLYDRADQALLMAKRQGRDRTVRWRGSG
jgi:diguanylate cyclase (GGDEF)-like protein